MKKFFFGLGLLFALLNGLFSCSKTEAEAGPEGPKGEQGIPGKDGAVIHKGNGSPAATFGNTGDMYLDMASAQLYGPKTNSDWGVPLNLKGDKGDTGTAGAAGSKILNGLVNPSSGLGAIGDYYLNKNTGDLFGPKTVLGWGTSINLKGTANVISSPVLDITWSLTVPNYSFTYDVPTPYLNAVGETSLQSMLNKGGVLLIYMIQGSAHYNMPLILSDNVSPYQYLMRSHNTNSFMLFVNRLNGSSIAGQPGLLTKFRFVLIPAGTQLPPSTGKLSSNTDFKNLSYIQLQELLNR